MKKSHTLKGSFEILLVIAVILLIPMLFAARSLAASSTTNATATVAWPASTPQGMASLNVAASPTVILPTAVARGKQPPACTFPLAKITAPKSKPENYSFSEPKVVLTAVEGNYYDIVEWLPDNQQVLMTEDLYDVSKSEGRKVLRQSIELHNLIMNTPKKVYAIRNDVGEPPSWQPELGSVVYSDMNFLGIDKNTRQPKFTRQVWMSSGNPKATQMLADNLPQFSLATKPGGSAVMYLSGKKISKLDSSLQVVSSPSFDLTQWDYRTEQRDQNAVSYEMTWQPGTSLIFLHSNGGTQLGGGYTFMLNADTGQLCEVNLGGWAVRAHWSLDGRYLAVVRADISSALVNSTDMTILDTTTGKLSTTMVVPQETKGKHYITDFVWAPDNRHLLALESLPSQITASGENAHHELYLVDFIFGESIHLFPEYKSFFADGAPKNNFAWSSDGSNLLIRCPTNLVDRVCLISVQKAK